MEVIVSISESITENPEMWVILENLINELILYGDKKNREILKTIDYLFNSYEINRYIPNDFTSTLCLLINNIYLVNETQVDTTVVSHQRRSWFSVRWLDIGDEVFDCYIAVINYCYVIYNNIWSSYEKKMEKNEFGNNLLSILYRLQSIWVAVISACCNIDL